MKPKSPAAEDPLRLAERALAGGWPVEEVASTLTAITGPPVVLSEPPPHPASLVSSSKVLKAEFARIAARKR